MHRLISGLVLLAVFAFSTGFYQQFYLPKLIVFYAIAIACLVFLATRTRLLLPSSMALVFMALFLLVAALLGVRPLAPLSGFMQWSYYFGAVLLFLVVLNFDHAGTQTLLKTVYGAALAQLALVIPQFMSLQGIMPQALIGRHDHLFGTVGNQEFLATLLGVGFFLGLHLLGRTEERKMRVLLVIANAALLLGLVLAQNKGALLFMGLYFLRKRFSNPAFTWVLGLAALLAVATVFPTSINGRLLLWLAAASMFAQHFAMGVGLLQFENQYLDVVHQLFGAYPALSGKFGSQTAMALDAHNIFLQFGAELGIAGLLLSLVFVAYGLRLVSANRSHLGIALLFLIFKSLYTVVLASITGMLVFVVLLAVLTERRACNFTGRPRRAVIAFAPLASLMFVAAGLLAHSDYFYQQGARALFMGQRAQAADDFNRALSINRENPDAHLGLAQASYLAGDHAAMRGHIEQALRFQRTKDTYKIAASMFYYSRLYDEAFEIYQFLHATFPQHLTSTTKLASIYMLRREYDKAHTMAQSVLHADPRQRADSDAKNIRIARQIVADSQPFIARPEN